MIEWLLDLEALNFGGERVQFAFARPLAAWAWVLVAIGSLMLAWISYRRVEGPRRWRGPLAWARALTLLLIVVLIAGPQLVRPNETEEKDWLIVLADRSASMTIADVASGTSRITREAQLRDAMSKSSDVFRELEQDRVVLWLGFGAGAYELDSRDGIVDLGDPTARRTSLSRSLEQALARAAARPVSGVVLLTDGRSVDEPTSRLLRRFRNEGIRIFSVPLGSTEPMLDMAVRSTEAPRVVFVDDTIPVEVEIERLGGADSAAGGTVQLVDVDTGLVLDEQRIDEGEAVEGDELASRFTLTTRSDAAGQRHWAVRIVPDVPDLVDENNVAEFHIETIDRPLRVVYFDGSPRWEYRYLRSVLTREKSIKSSTTILAPGRRYLEEGDEELGSLPTSPDQWAPFDVIVIGDMRPEMFSEEQLRQIRTHVAERGAGLVWIGGEGQTPGAWRGTPMEDLLPFTLGDRGDAIAPWRQPVVVKPTDAADQYGVLRLLDEPVSGSFWPPELEEPSTGWSRLWYAQRIDSSLLKPTAETLAVGVPGSDVALDEVGSPLVVLMRYGAGRVLYVGTDEIWRWRYGRGEMLYERFWLQLVRLLGRESVARSGKLAVMQAAPRRAEVDQPVRIALELLDQILVADAAGTIRVRATRLGGVNSVNDDESDGPASFEMTLAESGAAGPTRKYATTWIPTQSGLYRVDAIDPLLAGLGLNVEVEVWLAEDELRRPETNHAILAQLSAETEGVVLQTTELARLKDPDVLPDRSVVLSGQPDIETLWDTPAALIALIVLLAFEWIGRRLIRLV